MHSRHVVAIHSRHVATMHSRLVATMHSRLITAVHSQLVVDTLWQCEAAPAPYGEREYHERVARQHRTTVNKQSSTSVVCVHPNHRAPTQNALLFPPRNTFNYFRCATCSTISATKHVLLFPLRNMFYCFRYATCSTISATQHGLLLPLIHG
jgi:hypothetical protein